MPEYRRKLIEVALPLEAINRESAREKSIRHGHPSTLHLWWARRPLATCRAVLFASLVDDPSSRPDEFPTSEAQEGERQRLFRILEELVKWENSANPQVLGAARAEILRSTGGNPPPVLDPFCGGGSIPLEAQRLGLEAHGTDLNPVPVLITKALIEIPSRFAGHAPVNAQTAGKLFARDEFPGARGLAEDVRHYGAWMRDEAFRRIGHLYPTATLSKEQGGGEARVIAWLWTRTVTCPNPACGAEMPLVRSFWLSKKKGQQAWVDPIVDRVGKKVSFAVQTGEGSPVDGTVGRKGAKCLICGTTTPLEQVRHQARAGDMKARLMAMAVEGHKGRVYVPPAEEHELRAVSEQPSWKPDAEIAYYPGRTNVVRYGMTTFADLFTPRQLVALSTFSDLVAEAKQRVHADAVAAGLSDDGQSLDSGGAGASAYSDAVATYLAFGVSRLTDICNSLCRWESSKTQVRNLFGRQAIPMVWDFAEPNVFAQAAGDYLVSLTSLSKVLDAWVGSAETPGDARQLDATAAIEDVSCPVFSTDPPYYDNISYADLSDFFYVWLRRSLRDTYPQLLSTLLVPKAQELIAAGHRFDGGKAEAAVHFETGLAAAFGRMRDAQNSEYPLTVYYAFKQAETDEDESGSSAAVSTGWETMLEGLLKAGFAVLGTWPVRTELTNKVLAVDRNVLASSIVLVCRPRPEDAPMGTRAEFLRALRNTLPEALRALQHGNIAPVDLAQAAIGPGMAVYSSYSKVMESDGTRMGVRPALGVINSVLDEVLAKQEGEYDPSTRWTLAWFEQSGYETGSYGVAEVLAKAKAISVEALARDGFLLASAGKVRLLRREELSADWNPATDARLTVWEITQYLVKALEEHGESTAAALAHAVGPALGETARDLAYRLYSLCERKGWAKEAMPYNSLVVAWPAIVGLAASQPTVPQQTSFIEE